MGAAADLLSHITSAVTPVVLIAAAASLILGVNQKQANLADRLRSLAAEYRLSETAWERRVIIRRQVALLARRFRWTTVAHIELHVAVAAFVGMVLVLTLTRRVPFWDRWVLGLFVLGVTLLLGAVTAELFDLTLARRTVSLDINDVLAPDSTEPPRE